MNIGPISPPSPQIGVTEPIMPAYERVKQMLFKPFDLAKWFTIGFCAWLAMLGESGGFNTGYNFNMDNRHNGGNHPAESFRHFYFQARDYVQENFYWIVPVAIILVLFSLALWVTLVWLNSRGKFMFLHCVALDTAEVQVPWQKYADVANSLCWFRLGLGLAGMVLMLPLLVLIAVVIVKMIVTGGVNVPAIMLSVGLTLVSLLLALVFGIIRKFLVDFVVPIMFLRGCKCLAAWREFGGLLASRPGQFALYLLFQIVLAIAIGTLVIFAVLLTCCIAGCLMALPYLGTVLFLPVLIFQRSYALYYLAQYGPQYDVFPVPPASESPPPPTTLVPLAG